MKRYPRGFPRAFGKIPNGSICVKKYSDSIEYLVKVVIAESAKPICLRLYPGSPVTSYRPSTQWRGAASVQDDDVFFVLTDVYVHVEISSLKPDKLSPEAGDISFVGPYTVLNISTDKGNIGINLLDGTIIKISEDTPVISFSEWSLMQHGTHNDTVLFNFTYKPD